MNEHKETRELKVYSTAGNNRTVPQIRLQGEWLDAAGFKAGDRIVVEVRNEELRITLADVLPAENK